MMNTEFRKPKTAFLNACWQGGIVIENCTSVISDRAPRQHSPCGHRAGKDHEGNIGKAVHTQLRLNIPKNPLEDMKELVWTHENRVHIPYLRR